MPALDPVLVTALPLESRGYAAFFRGTKWRWWRPLVALLMAAVGAILFMLPPIVIGVVIDGPSKVLRPDGTIAVGPWTFLGNNVGIALFLPIAFFTSWALFSQRPGWLSSVAGRFRWRWFAVCSAVVFPLWLGIMIAETILTGLPVDLGMRPYTVVMIVGILLTTPLQAAGEEYMVRGLELRAVASFFKNERWGWTAGALVSSVTFMALHGANDAWLNLFYFAFGMISAWLVWRTGGLEASVALHVANNMMSEVFLPVTDFTDIFSRTAGSGNPGVLIPLAAAVVVAALLSMLATSRQVERTSAPGRAEYDAACAAQQQRWETWARNTTTLGN